MNTAGPRNASGNLGRSSERSLYSNRQRILPRGGGADSGSHSELSAPKLIPAFFIKRGDRYELVGPFQINLDHEALNSG